MQTSISDLAAPEEMSAMPHLYEIPSSDSESPLWLLPRLEACCQDRHGQHRM